MKPQKKKTTMKKYNLLAALFIAITGFSQSYKGSLDTIKEDGLHKIMLSQKIRSSSNENFNILRIKDAQKNEVPYVLIYNNDRNFSTFKTIKIASKKVIKDSVTSIIIKNESGKKQDYIILKIANTKIRKSYNVYGSDNGKDWFGLISDKKLSYINIPNKTASGNVFLEKTINFPLNTYTFLRINFNDKNSLPINVLEAGVYESKFFTQEPLEVSNYKQKAITLKDKKVTQLKFSAENAHKINTISFDITTDFFLRNAKVIVKRTRKIKKRIETYDQVIGRFQLNSKNKNTFVLNNLNEKEFSIEIENKDNPPLAIKNVQLLQKPVYVIANLKEQEKYTIVIDTTLIKPSYDLGNFISNKTIALKEASVLNFSKVKQEAIKLKTTPFWETKIFMWLCIVFGGFLVVYFAFGLIKDISTQEK